MWRTGEVGERMGREFPWALKKVREVVCEGGMEELKGLEEKVSGEVWERVYGCYGVSEAGGWQVRFGVKGMMNGGGGMGMGMGMEEIGAGTKIYLLDEGLEPVPEGVVGEVYVGGEGVGAGYWGREEKTAENFVPDPWSGGRGVRMYRTGDLGRRRKDGGLEYRGRRDRRWRQSSE